MPRFYRSETVDAIYAAMLAHAPLLALVGQPSKIIRNNQAGRIRRIEWRAPSDFAFIEVLVGPSHGGEVYKIQTFAGMDTAARTAEFTLECVWNQQDDGKRDQIESEMLACVESLVDSVDGIVSINFRSATGTASIAGKQDKRDATRLIVSVTYELDAADTA